MNYQIDESGIKLSYDKMNDKIFRNTSLHKVSQIYPKQFVEIL